MRFRNLNGLCYINPLVVDIWHFLELPSEVAVLNNIDNTNNICMAFIASDDGNVWLRRLCSICNITAEDENWQRVYANIWYMNLQMIVVLVMAVIDYENVRISGNHSVEYCQLSKWSLATNYTSKIKSFGKFRKKQWIHVWKALKFE